MDTKDRLAEMRNSFLKRYAPKNDEFELALDRLIYMAWQAAQEPFVRELKMFREVALSAAALAIADTPDPAPRGVSGAQEKTQ